MKPQKINCLNAERMFTLQKADSLVTLFFSLLFFLFITEQKVFKHIEYNTVCIHLYSARLS